MSTDYTITLTLSDITTSSNNTFMTVNTIDTNSISYSYYVTLNQPYTKTSDSISQNVSYNYTVDNSTSYYMIYNLWYIGSDPPSQTSPNLCNIYLYDSYTSCLAGVNIYDYESCSGVNPPTFSGQRITTTSSNGTTYNNISIGLSNDLETTTLTCSNYKSFLSYNKPVVGNSYNTIYTFNFVNNQIVTITLNNTFTSNNLWVLNNITIVNKNNLANNNQIGIAVGFLSNIFFGLGTNPYNEPNFSYNQALVNNIITNSVQINGMLAPILQLYL